MGPVINDVTLRLAKMRFLDPLRPWSQNFLLDKSVTQRQIP